MPNSVYFLDIYIPNENEPDTALEVAVLRYNPSAERPSVYIHSFIKPKSIPRVRWNIALEYGVKREFIANNNFPSMSEILSLDYLKDKTVVCLNPTVAPFSSMVKNAKSTQSILSMWQEYAKDDENVASFTKPQQMLYHLGLPENDESDTKYTPLLSGLFSQIAIWHYLTMCAKDSSYKNLSYVEKLTDISSVSAWPILNRDDFLSKFDFVDLDNLPEDSIEVLLSPKITDYLDWFHVNIYAHDWVFNRRLLPSVAHLNNKISMADFVYNKALAGSVMRTWILICYVLYEGKSDLAKLIAYNKSESFSNLPDSVREDFSNFIIVHLDDFLNIQIKMRIIDQMIAHSLELGDNKPFENYDFDALYKEYRKSNQAESQYQFRSTAIGRSKNKKCFKEIVRSANNRVLFRSYEIVGDEEEISQSYMKVNELFKNFIQQLKDPLSDFWFHEDLISWIQFITGFTWEEITGKTQKDDPQLTQLRETLVNLIMVRATPYAKKIREDLSNALSQMSKVGDRPYRHELVFQGVSIAVVYRKEKPSLLKRLFRF